MYTTNGKMYFFMNQPLNKEQVNIDIFSQALLSRDFT